MTTKSEGEAFMRGNIVAAAVICGIAFVVGCGVLVLGARWALAGPFDRLTAAVERHGDLTSAAGERAGKPIEAGLSQLAEQVDRHATSITEAGRTIASPRVTMLGPVSITDQEPIRIQGVQGKDGSLPIDVKLPPKK
jgi:hypothetical protein